MKTLSRMAFALASLLSLSAVLVSVSACTVTSERDDSPNGGNNPTNPNPSPTPTGTSSSTPPSNAACGDIAGTWGTSGTCGNDTCVITQSGCNTNFECSDGAASYTGTVSGSDVAYSGVTGSCRGVLSGSKITGTCQTSGVTCTFSATKR